MLVDRSAGPGEGRESGRTHAGRPTVSVVVVAYGAEPWLECCVDALLASRGVVVDVVLVDNGCSDGAVDRLRGRSGVTVVDPGTNSGFAAGCNLGATYASGAFLALVNPDAVVDPDALARLTRTATREEVGIATCSLRLGDRPDLLNSAGNEVHFLGLSWSGAFEEPAASRPAEAAVAAASGAGMVMRRGLWDELGGFVPEFFAYQEDTELSIRTWLAGYRVVYEPLAVIVHRYEFSRNPVKFFLLDRNRLILVLTLFSARTLGLLAPALLLQEVAMFGVAAAQGWLPQRLRSIVWLLRHGGWLRARRAAAARTRRRSDKVLAPLLVVVVDPGNHAVPSWAVRMQAPLALYWRAVRRLL